MGNSAARPQRSKQTGYIILLIMLVLVAGGATFFSGAYTSSNDASARESTRSLLALDTAATAVKIYSMTDEDRPGSLPCPDFSGDGITDINCLNSSEPVHVERLPWRTLDIGSDAAGLWYVMDRDFRDNTAAQPINAELEGSLIIESGAGVDATGFAALIIDPGDPLVGQNNRGRDSETVGDYLDLEENTDNDNRFVDCPSREDCNDRIIGVSTTELFRLVQRRLLADLKQPVEDFIDDAISTHGNLPYAAKLNSLECEADLHRGHLPQSQGECAPNEFVDPNDFPSWVTDNDWLELVIYHVDDACTEAPCSAGDLEVDGEAGLALVLAIAGGALPGQDRNAPELNIEDYLESGLVDGVYLNQPKSTSNNDLYWGTGP
mgnify:CR=1 FL=1